MLKIHRLGCISVRKETLTNSSLNSHLAVQPLITPTHPMIHQRLDPLENLKKKVLGGNDPNWYPKRTNNVV